MAIQAQISQHFQQVVASANPKPQKSKWEEFNDGLSLAATVATFGLVRKRKG